MSSHVLFTSGIRSFVYLRYLLWFPLAFWLCVSLQTGEIHLPEKPSCKLDLSCPVYFRFRGQPRFPGYSSGGPGGGMLLVWPG